MKLFWFLDSDWILDERTESDTASIGFMVFVCNLWLICSEYGVGTKCYDVQKEITGNHFAIIDYYRIHMSGFMSFSHQQSVYDRCLLCWNQATHIQPKFLQFYRGWEVSSAGLEYEHHERWTTLVVGRYQRTAMWHLGGPPHSNEMSGISDFFLYFLA